MNLNPINYWAKSNQNIWGGVGYGYKVMTRSKNGDRRHKDNKGINHYRRSNDKMPQVEMTRRLIALEKFSYPKPGDLVKIEGPITLRRRVLNWLLD